MAKNLLQNSCELVSVTPAAATDQVASPFGLVKIQSQIVSSVTTISFINLSNYPYKTFKLFGNFSGSTSIDTGVVLSSNNGATYITAGYSVSNPTVPAGSGSWASGAITSQFNINTGPGGSATQIAFEITLYAMNTASGLVSMTGLSTNTSGSGSYVSVLGGYLTTATNANALQITAGGTTTMTGTFSLYGYN